MLVKKNRQEIPFDTKRVKYTALWKKSIRIVKESKLSFFTTFPSSIFFFFFFHNFVIYAPQSWIPSSSSLLCFLLLLLLLIFIVFPPPSSPHPLPPPPPSIIIETRRRCRENNKNGEKVSLKLASKNLVRSKLKAPYGRGFPYGLLQAENTRSARCSRVVLSKLLAARQANFLSLLVLAKKSQCSKCSRMLAKTIRHPLNYFRVHTVLLTVVALFAFQVTFNFVVIPLRDFLPRCAFLYFLSTNKVPSLPEVSFSQSVINESYYSATALRPKMLLNWRAILDQTDHNSVRSR